MLSSHPSTILSLGTLRPPWPTRRPDKRPFTTPPTHQQPAPRRQHHSMKSCHRGEAKDGAPIDAARPKRAMRAHQLRSRQHTNHLISTTRHGRRARARTAAFLASALAPAPLPTTLKARDHGPSTNSCTGHLQTTAASTQERQTAVWSTRLERTSAPPTSSHDAAQRTSG